MFEPLKSVAFDILGPLIKSRRGFLYNIVIADWLSSMIQVVPLRSIDLVDVAHAFLKHWVFKNGQLETLFPENEKLLTSKFFQILSQLF